MLKLIYTETDLRLEHLTQSPETWIAKRVILSLRVGQPLLVEPCSASLLLPASLAARDALEAQVQAESLEAVAISICDPDCWEVSLRGIWLSARAEPVEGIFVAAIAPSIECLIFALWQDSQTATPPLRG